MTILNQPFQGQLGEELIKKLKNNSYSKLTIFSAFAKNSGVLRLKTSLKEFRKSGGSVTAFIGIDLDGTSYEALLNLFELCDKLYIIHSENMSTTFHSKIYLFENKTSAWCAVGSNNLTGGGLWTNFESVFTQEYKLPKQKVELDNIYRIVDKYSDPTYDCSIKISSLNQIKTLLDENYINEEISQKISSIKRRRTKGTTSGQKNPLFGSEKVSIPEVPCSKNATAAKTTKKNVTQPNVNQTNNTIQVSPAFTNEQFWFEMRKSTGGSRNILDLSKFGKIVEGSVAGTPYDYGDPTRMYGGVKFFEIDPNDIASEKNITINYQGKDYFPSTIKFAQDNGSWRIQLKGKPLDGSDELSKFGHRGDFVYKILVFEKINPDYYVLSLLDNNELDNIKSLSRVWSRNGKSATSKAYGML